MSKIEQRLQELGITLPQVGNRNFLIFLAVKQATYCIYPGKTAE